MQRLIQRSPQSAPAADATPATVERALGRPGAPLDRSVRQAMEAAFQSDFTFVRVHTGAEAAAAADEVQARAFTVGPDLVFGRGEYRPHTSGGQRLLAHELTHALQQRSSGALAPGVSQLTVSEPGEPQEQEAGRTAEQITMGRAPGSAAPALTHSGSPGTVHLQRQPTSSSTANSPETYATETKDEFATRVHDRAASRLTQNIGVLGQWSTYVNSMEGFQLRAQLLTQTATSFATTAAPTPSGRARFEEWAGTQNEALRAFRGSELDVESTYRERTGNFMGFLGSKVSGFHTTPSVAENFQVLAGDRRAEDLPGSVYVGPDPRYSEYAGAIRRFQSGESGGCQTCHDINLAWQRTADRWGDPLPQGDMWSAFSFTGGGRGNASGSAFSSSLSAGERDAVIAFIQGQGSNTTTAPASQPAATPQPAAEPTAAAPPNPFLPSTAIPEGVAVPPARTDLCGALPSAEDSARIPSLAAWGENSAIVAGVIARINSVLTPLGPRGYRVLPRQNFDALYAMSPDNMQSVRDGIIASINARKQQYADLRADIQGGGVPYEELCPIVDELLPSTNAMVKWQALDDVHRWQQRERLLQILELTLLALSIIYPPSLVVTIPAGMALGLARLSLGLDQQRQGRQWSQGTAAGLYSLSQEAEAPGLASRGRSNIIFGSLGFGLSALSFARVVSQARATAQLLEALEAGAVIRHVQYPGVALLARNGRLLMVTESGQVLGYGTIANGQISWTRLSIPYSPFGGAGGPGGAATGTSLVPYGQSAIVPFGGTPFGSSTAVPFGGSPLLTPGVVTPGLAGQGLPLLTTGPRLLGPSPPGSTLIVDAQAGYPTFLRGAVAGTPGSSGVGIEPGNFLLGYQGIHPTLPEDLAMARLIARNTPQWGQSYAAGAGGTRETLPITQWPRVGELSDLSLEGMSAQDALFWQSLATLPGRYRMPPAAIDPTAVFPGSTALVPSTALPGGWQVQPRPFAIPPAGEIRVITEPFFPAYGGLQPAISGPQGAGFSILRPRLIPRGAGDVAGITPTQHPELHGLVDQLYLRRPFGLGQASGAQTEALGAEINRMLRPGGFVELRLTRSDLLAPGQLQAIQAQIPGSTQVVIDQAAIDAFRTAGTLPADATQAAILRAAQADIEQAFDPLGLARMAQIIRIYKPAAR